MRTKNLLAIGLLLGTAALSHTFAAPGGSYTADRVTVASNRSFDQVRDSIKSLVARNGMMVMTEVDQGRMLSMTGATVKATLYLVGNPTVGKQLFEQTRGVGLYVPLRVFVYTDEAGKTHIAYDKPSSLLAQFHNEKIAMIAGMLDQKLEALASMAAR